MLQGAETPGGGSSDNCSPLCYRVLRPPGGRSSDNCYTLCYRVLRPPGGGSSDIFGTGAGTQVAPSPSRLRAPPSNNIFGEAPPPSAEKPKHDRMKSNVFGGGDPDSAPGSARKSSKTYESRVFGETESNQNKSGTDPIHSKRYVWAGLFRRRALFVDVNDSDLNVFDSMALNVIVI